MNLSLKSAILLLLISLLSMPLWLVLTEPYVVKPSPLKLFEAIHPTYYVGLASLALLLTILSVKALARPNLRLNPYLATALLSAFYIQLPLIVLFEHPINCHIDHTLLLFYILREGSIDMPNYLIPETISPQLFASIFFIVTSLPSPLENVHRISVIILPVLYTLYIYLFMRKMEVNERFAMMASVLNNGLFGACFQFLRYTYTMPFYILASLLFFMALKKAQPSLSILLIIISASFIMMDPAHVILLIAALMLFAIIWAVLHLVGKVAYLRNQCSSIAFLSTIFTFWVINRKATFPVEIIKVAEAMVEVYHKSITEFAYPHITYHSRGRQAISTPLYEPNIYFLYVNEIRIVLVVVGIFLPIMLLFYMFFNKKIRPTIFRLETIYLISHFLVTLVVFIGRGYNLTVIPWIAVSTFYLINRSNIVKQLSYKKYRIIPFILTPFILIAMVVEPHFLLAGSRIRIETKDIFVISFLERSSLQDPMASPGIASWFTEILLIKDSHVLIYDHPFYEGISSQRINKLVEHNAIIIPEATLIHFEKTKYCYLILEILEMLTHKLSNTHGLIYNSGNPYVTIWLRT